MPHRRRGRRRHRHGGRWNDGAVQNLLYPPKEDAGRAEHNHRVELVLEFRVGAVKTRMCLRTCSKGGAGMSETDAETTARRWRSVIGGFVG